MRLRRIKKVSLQEEFSNADETLSLDEDRISLDEELG